MFFCQVPPKKSTVAVLDFGPVGRLRRRWLSGMRTRSAGGGCGGGCPGTRRGTLSAVAWSTVAAWWVWPSGHGGAVAVGPSWPWPDTPGEVVGGGISGRTRPAGLSCHETPSRVVTRSGRWERRETPGAEVIGNTQGGGSGRRWSRCGGKPLRTGIFILKRGCACSIFYFFLKKGVFTLQSKCKINNF